MIKTSPLASALLFLLLLPWQVWSIGGTKPATATHEVRPQPKPAFQKLKPRLLVFLPATPEVENNLRRRLQYLTSLDIAHIPHLRHLQQAVIEEDHVHILAPAITVASLEGVIILAQPIPSPQSEPICRLLSHRTPQPDQPLEVGVINLSGYLHVSQMLESKRFKRVRTVTDYQDVLSLLQFDDVDAILAPLPLIKPLQDEAGYPLHVLELPPVQLDWRPVVAASSEDCPHGKTLEKALADLNTEELFGIPGWTFH